MAKTRHPEREMRGDSQGRQSFMRTEATSKLCLQWRRTYGDRGGTLYPQVQDLYPLYPQSQRCGLCQNFKQTTLTTRLYKVRTNLYPPTYENVPTRLFACKLSRKRYKSVFSLLRRLLT